MGASRGAALFVAGLALFVPSSRAFLLNSARCSSRQPCVPALSSSSSGRAHRASRSPQPPPPPPRLPAAASFTGTTLQPVGGSGGPRCSAAYAPTAPVEGVTTAATTSMRLGASFLMPAGARRLAFAGLTGAATSFATVGGGVLAGGLHAVSGPDHLAALLPRIMGQKWHNSMRIGAAWGLGHGFSATVIGLVAFFCKDRLGLGHNERLVDLMGTWTEGLVGVSLIAIGLVGLKESLLDYEETPAFEAKSAGSAVVEGAGVGGGGRLGGGAVAAAKSGGKAIFLNGVLHGFSWDGAPSLAPALALSSWGSVLWFLLAYCSGTMVAMSATTTLIGEGSLRVGQALDQPDIPRKLSIVSSFIAIAIGAAWLAKAVFF